ncbi:component of the polarisome [Kickxella alabastrina]|uniref:Component of the polarisome n=1 Tax=Kickxella alabastrina TaxID=61397 RepID=A0ACC1IIQ1_9FUNG|nr:component of the polarisome [Kickxella alabastrina]
MEVTAGQYHREMSKFILDEIDQGVSAPTKSELGKLSRLTPMQFQELATDVYDELKRRRSENQEFPFLPVRDHYHPKRNQARQKLATLSRPKFVDLVHDVNEELKRRFPHKIDTTEFATASSRYDPMNMANVQSALPIAQQFQSSQFGQQSGFGQYQMSRSPPTSSGSTQGYAHSMNAPVSAIASAAGRGGSFSHDDADNDGNRGLRNSQLGQTARVPTPDRSVRMSTSDLEKLKNEYEMRLSAMRKRVGQLESQMLDRRGDGSQSSIDAEQISNIERMNAALAQKNERLENELKLLRDQLVTARSDVPALRQENDKLRIERTRFIERERELKIKLDEARAKVRRLKATSVFAMDHGDTELVPPPVFVNSGGVIRPSSVRAFQEAVEALLSAVRSENMDVDLPNAQSFVVAACGELKADVTAYQAANAGDSSTWPLPRDTLENTPEVVLKLETHLDGLAHAVDKHLNSMGVLPISLLEAAASHLATAVVDLVKLLKVCFDESKAAPRATQAMPMPAVAMAAAAATAAAAVEAKQAPTSASANTTATSANSFDQHGLESSTDNIIAGIQSMLQLVRAPSPAPNALFSTLQRVIVSIRETINISRAEFDNIETGSGASEQLNVDLYNRAVAKGVLDGLEKGHLQLTDQLNDINEAHDAAGGSDMDNEIVRELLNEMAFKQRLTSALIDVGKLTKTLVLWLE